ncbi:MAG TPA: glycosyltransferase family A protein [Terriglobales bacterium]|nr:glycosyltransferase family A protein [Terriglobales bacterium]
MKDCPLVTVFTPTFNREVTIHRPYESLCRQTNRDFEWLIVDDGSADRTQERVSAWQAHARFPIRYVWQENASKAAAWNRGLQEARGQFFVCLDSDDECLPEALATLLRHWNELPIQHRAHFSGVTSLTLDETGKPYGPPLPAAVIDCTPVEAHFRFHLWETWHFYRTEIAKQFPFELIAGYRQCLYEGTVINRMATKYQQRHIAERLRIFHTEQTPGAEGHLSVGITSSTGIKHGPGLRAVHLSLLRYHCAWIFKDPAKFYRAAANYIRFSFAQGIGAAAQLRDLQASAAQVLWIVALPAGLLLNVRDRIRRTTLAKGIRGRA